MNNNYQAQIVGYNNIPERRDRGTWDFLNEYVDNLKPGQAVRLVIDKKTSTNGVASRWSRLLKGKAGFRQQRQEDSSFIVWLWIKNNGRE